MFRRTIVLPCTAAVLACGKASDRATVSNGSVPVHTDAPATATVPGSGAAGRGTPNEMGRIVVLEYHLFGEKDGRWERSSASFRKDLELLYSRGYRPISVSDLIDKKIDLAAGLSPIVFTFDDASPGQFRYIERNGKLEIDPTSAIGVWLDFRRTHPDWANRATFCVLSGAEAGRSFFGNKNIEGQKTEWRFQKVRFLVDLGFELCDHTLWHPNLQKYDDAFVAEQIARGVMAIDSAVPGYKVRTFALPLGMWPKNRAMARAGSWTDKKSGRIVRYDFDAILEVAGQPNPSPHRAEFDPLSIDRFQVFNDRLAQLLDQLDRSGTRYVSDGVSSTIANGPTGDSAGAHRVRQPSTRTQ